MSGPSDKRSVSLAFRPIDRFSLSFEGSQNVIGMIFDDEILDVTALWAALGARLTRIYQPATPCGSSSQTKRS